MQHNGNTAARLAGGFRVRCGDVLVIMDTDRPFIERQRELYELWGLPVDLDLFCYTPDEFEKLQHRPFLRYALTSERVLYEKKPA